MAVTLTKLNRLLEKEAEKYVSLLETVIDAHLYIQAQAPIVRITFTIPFTISVEYLESLSSRLKMLGRASEIEFDVEKLKPLTGTVINDILISKTLARYPSQKSGDFDIRSQQQKDGFFISCTPYQKPSSGDPF